MATFIDLQNNIVDDLDGRTDLTTQIKREINRAIKFYAKDSFWFQEAKLDFYLSFGTDTYDGIDGVPFGIRDIFLMELYDEGSDPAQKYRIWPQTLSTIEWQGSPTTGNGMPNFYTYFAQTLKFDYPSQSDNYHIYIYGVEEYVDLVDDDDENGFTQNAEDLIEARALRMVNARTLKNEQIAASCAQREAEAYMALQQKSTKLTMKGPIRASRF